MLTWLNNAMAFCTSLDLSLARSKAASIVLSLAPITLKKRTVLIEYSISFSITALITLTIVSPIPSWEMVWLTILRPGV
ncbi:hypothetical protein D3C72_1611300 [compost metagenome]